jgi:hypothetical protein
MAVAAKELREKIAKIEQQVEITEQAGERLEEELTEKVGALLVEIARQHVSTRQQKIPPVLEAAIRAGKLIPSQRAVFVAHLMAVPFEEFDAELEKVRLSFEEAPQVIELGVEYGDGCGQFKAPGSGQDPETREELEDELKSTVGPQTKAISSSGIREERAAEEAQELEKEVK